MTENNTAVAIVTGAGGGIGEAIVQTLATNGAQVIAVDVKPEPQSLGKLDAVTYLCCDLTKPESMTEIFQAIGPDGCLDYVVNAAGIADFDRDGSMIDVEDTFWSRVMSINVDVMRQLTVQALPFLRRGEGKSIVNLASIAGLRNMDAPLDAYQVSKAAIVSLTRSLAVQLGPEGIRANTVCPGAILTPMIAPIYEASPARRENMEQKTPLRRLGTAADVAAAVRFLLSADARFITGIDLTVDGGWIAQIK